MSACWAGKDRDETVEDSWREEGCAWLSTSSRRISRVGRLVFRRRNDCTLPSVSTSTVEVDETVVLESSSKSNRWDRLDGFAELGVRGACVSELSRTARSVARRVREGLPVARDEGRDEDGEGISIECPSCLSTSVSWTWVLYGRAND